MVESDVIGILRGLFESRGSKARRGGLSITEHSLQTAHLAEREQAPSALVCAALLHDIGLLLDDASVLGAHHDVTGFKWLSRFFPPAVTEPIRHHVHAKHYLVTRSPHYKTRLSSDALRRLHRDGGKLDDLELHRFGRSPHFLPSLLLRRWIDTAKIPGLRVPDFDHFVPALEEQLAETTRATA